MYLLQQPVRPVTGLVSRSHTPHVRVKHPVGVLLDPHHSPAFAALDDDLYLPVVLPLCLQNAPQGADRVDLIRFWLVDRRVVLGRQKYLPLAGHRLLKCRNRTWSPDLKRHLCKGENNDIPYWNHGKALDVRGHLI